MSNKYTPAIVLVGYNRPDSLKRLLASVAISDYQRDDIPLIFSFDCSDCTDVLVRIAQNFFWKHGVKHIRTFERRQGLRSHILQCGDLSEQYGAVIILEDDLVVSRDFYSYTKQALEYYDDMPEVAGIALYSHKYNGYAMSAFEPVNNGFDTYMGRFSVSWGQAWSKKQWSAFRMWYDACRGELQERSTVPSEICRWSINSWGKYFAYYLDDTKRFYCVPYVAHTTSFADVGQHTSKIDCAHQVPLQMGKRQYHFASVQQAIKYDLFFENMQLEKSFPVKIQEQGICCNLYGHKKATEKRYMLTTKQMNRLVVQSFGMLMYPKDLNVICQIPGRDILLYDLFTESKNDFKKQAIRVRDFEFRFFDWHQTRIHVQDHLWEHIVRRIKRLLRRE